MVKYVTKLVGILIVLSVTVHTVSAQECGEWSDIFPSGNLFGSPQDWVMFDDGSGEALYTCGSFIWPGWLHNQSVLRFRNGRWEEFGSLQAGHAQTLFVYDDQSGSQLYVAYDKTPFIRSGVSRWNGVQWERIATFNDRPRALAEFGSELYVAGDFTQTDGSPTNYIAKWDGSGWSQVGTGLMGFNDNAHCLAVFDDGTGPSLYAGGEFRIAGTAEAIGIARWDGALWHPLEEGVKISSGDSVYAMSPHDDGSGPALYVGGKFESVGNFMPGTNGIARWDGTAWSSVGGGVVGRAYAFQEFITGGKAALCVAGSGVNKWDGNTWTAVGPSGTFSGSNGLVFSMGVFDDGNGPLLFAGGSFDWLGDIQARDVAVWDGLAWSVPPQGFFDPIEHLAVVAEKSGKMLYAAGQFETAGNVASKYIIKWDGTEWSGLAGGINDRIYDIAMFDDGSGEALYATGRFTFAGGAPIKYIAKWDGQQWTPLGPGINGQGSRLIVFDDGTGPALYAAGQFNIAGLVSANGIAKWNGFYWSSVGANISEYVTALAVHDDGTGDALYVAASTSGPSAFTTVYRWDGVAWSTIPAGGQLANILTMVSWDDGGGSDLYLGGIFDTMGGVSARSIARWDGSSISSLRTGLVDNSSTARVYTLSVFDDGGGSALYAGGTFTRAGALALGDVAKWDGDDWFDVGGGTDNGGVFALGSYNLGGGQSLYAGGGFREMSGVSSDHIARLDADQCGCYVDCDHSTGFGVLDIFDFLCFQSAFVNGESYACDCDVSTGTNPLVCDIFDFLCYQDQFVIGCP